MRGISTVISIAILLPVIIALGMAMWIYSQNATTRAMEYNRIYNELIEKSAESQIAVIYNANGTLLFQLTLTTSDESYIYLTTIYVKGTTIMYTGNERYYIPINKSYIDIENSTNWQNTQYIDSTAKDIDIQPPWSSSGQYFRLSDFIGDAEIKLAELHWRGEPIIVLVDNVQSPVDGAQAYVLLLYTINNQYYEIGVINVQAG